MKILVERRTRGALVGLSLMLSLSSCGSFMTPAGSDITPEQALKNHPPKQYSMDEAVSYARAVQSDYLENIDDQFLLRNITDLALIPIAGAAAFYGISGAHTDVLLGLAVAGTGTYLIGERYSRTPEQLIYASGALAINCVLGTFRGQRVGNAYRNSLITLVGGATYDANKQPVYVEGRLFSTSQNLRLALAPVASSADPVVLEARGRLATAESVLDMGQAALNELDLAGDDLVNAVEAVKAQVADGLARKQIDGGAFKAAVENAFLSSLTSIPEAEDQTASGADVKLKTKITEGQRKELIRLTSELNSQIRQVRDISEKIGAPPSPEALAKCAVDVDAIGVSLAVSTEQIKLDATGADNTLDSDRTVSFQVFGGTPPYFAFWSGGYFEGKVEQPTITSAGVVSAKLKQGHPAGSFRIAVRDSGKLLTPKSVKIQVGAPPLPGGGASVGEGGGLDPDKNKDLVLRAKEFLRANGISEVEVDGETIEIEVKEGFGQETRVALRQYLASLTLEGDGGASEAKKKYKKESLDKMSDAELFELFVTETDLKNWKAPTETKEPPAKEQTVEEREKAQEENPVLWRQAYLRASGALGGDGKLLAVDGIDGDNTRFAMRTRIKLLSPQRDEEIDTLDGDALAQAIATSKEFVVNQIQSFLISGGYEKVAVPSGGGQSEELTVGKTGGLDPQTLVAIRRYLVEKTERDQAGVDQLTSAEALGTMILAVWQTDPVSMVQSFLAGSKYRVLKTEEGGATKVSKVVISGEMDAATQKAARLYLQNEEGLAEADASALTPEQLRDRMLEIAKKAAASAAVPNAPASAPAAAVVDLDAETVKALQKKLIAEGLANEAGAESPNPDLPTITVNGEFDGPTTKAGAAFLERENIDIAGYTAGGAPTRVEILKKHLLLTE